MKFSAVLIFMAAIAISATTAAPSVSDDEGALQAVDNSIERRGGGGSQPPSDSCTGTECDDGSDHSHQCQWGNQWYNWGKTAYCPQGQNCKWYACECTEYGWKNCWNRCKWEGKWYEPYYHYNNPTECKHSGRRSGGNSGSGQCTGDNCNGGGSDGEGSGGSGSCGYYCECRPSGKWSCQYTDNFDENYQW